MSDALRHAASGERVAERWSPPLRLAYFSPLPPARSGIADYSREILPHLAQIVDLTLFCVDPDAAEQALHEQFPIYRFSDYAKMRWRFDLPLYQMGNNTTHHEEIYRMSRRYPGAVVLHDVILHLFIAHRTVGQGNFPGYTREMGYVLGETGVNYSWAIRHGERQHPLTELTLNQRVVDLSLGTLVHSHHALDLIHATRPQHPVWVIPAPIAAYEMPLDEPPSAGSAPLAPQHPWREDAIVFASVGQITAAKRLDRALAAFARLRHEMPLVRYLLVGEVFQNEVDLPALLEEYDLGDDVHVTGFVPDLPTFMGWLATADVVVNLRYPTVGETSAAALRALSAGRPLIVYDHGWYAELPDEVALKAPLLDDDALVAAMRRLASDAQLRMHMGHEARAYAGGQHPAHTARAYVRAIEEILAPYA
jgi:glycosyltransferase involved in cell wall biosynthesis